MSSIQIDVKGTFELDGQRVTFSITGDGPEDYEVTTRGHERFDKACELVEGAQRVLIGQAVAIKRHWGSAA
jgi:hypothetical protein